LKRKAWGLRVERLLGRRGTLRRRLAGIGGGVAVAAAGVFGFAVVAGVISFETPACETAISTLPDYQAAPFAFDPEARAYEFVQAMADDDFETAYSMVGYEPELRESHCDFALEAFWNSQLQGHSSYGGELVVVRPAAVQAFDPFHDAVFLQFRMQFDSGFTFEPAGQVTVHVWGDGRVFPTHFRATGFERTSRGYPIPPYARGVALEEIDMTIEGPGGDLSAILAIPHGPGPFPAAVLVPGMWDELFNDRDGTTPDIKPLRDLAWGLASHGIATLRYDKRTWAHAAAAVRQPDFTLTDEYVEDALAAVELLRRIPTVDPHQIHVLAFERAGLAGPQIAQRDQDLAGLILFSAPSGTIWDAYLSIRERETRTEHQEALSNSDADVRARARDQINRELGAYQRFVADAKALAAGEVVANLTLRPAYHRDLAGYRPEEVARGLQLPILVVHGALHRLGSGTFNDWLESLHQHPNASFFLYPDHYDYLLDGKEWREAGTPSRRDAALPRHVAPEAVADIADWIRGGRPKDVCIGTQTGPNGCRGGPDARVRV